MIRASAGAFSQAKGNLVLKGFGGRGRKEARLAKVVDVSAGKQDGFSGESGAGQLMRSYLDALFSAQPQRR